MIELHRMKEGDTRPPVFATLYDPDGSPVDLSGASVRFQMAEADGTLVLDLEAELMNGGVYGSVRFDGWTTDHTAVAGEYIGEFVVTFADGGIQSWPRERQGFPIIITKDI